MWNSIIKIRTPLLFCPASAAKETGRIDLAVWPRLPGRTHSPAHRGQSLRYIINRCEAR